MAKERAAAAFKSGNYEAAIEAYTEALEAADGAEAKAVLLSNRAQCHIGLQHFVDAREDAATARALHPSNVKAWFRLGVCEARLGALSEAEAAFLQAAQLQPNDAAIVDEIFRVRRRLTESSGRFDWPTIYSQYIAPEPGIPDSRIEALLDVEPFIGPIRIGIAPGRGRALFATEAIAPGQLIMCAKAVVTGKNEEVLKLLQRETQSSSAVREAVLSLSQGTAESESAVPACEPSHYIAPPLQHPSDNSDGEQGLAADELEKELQSILHFNQFSLPVVNARVAPLEVTCDPGRSGLWLLPSFCNHACWPNVQRIFVRDALFIRAGRSIEEGEELFDCYCEALQPLERRRQGLQGHNIDGCLCERCLLEEAVLPKSGVKELIEKAANAKAACGNDSEAVSARLETITSEVEVFVARSLEEALQGQKVPDSLPHLPLPAAHLTAERMAMLREGFEIPSDSAEEAAFKRQELLHQVLLASFANVFRAHAVSLKQSRHSADSTVAWKRVLSTVEVVLPCSELAAIVSTEVLLAKTLGCHLDVHKVCRPELLQALHTTHRAYSGGGKVWRLLNGQTFATTILDVAEQEWAKIAKEKKKLEGDSYDAASLMPKEGVASKIEARAKPQVGFEDLLRRKARQHQKEAGAAAADAADVRSEPAGDGDVLGAEPDTTQSHKAAVSKELPDSVAADVASASSTTRTSTSARVTCSEQEVIVVIPLPGLASANEADLEISDNEVHVRSTRTDVPHNYSIALPRSVEPSTAHAKWSKRNQELTVRVTAKL